MGQHRIFYGWLVVAVAFLAYFVSAGLTPGAVYGVLLKPMSQEMGWMRATTVGAATLGGVVTGLASPFVGAMVDRYGARVAMVVGAIIAGAVLFALSQIQALWQIYLLYGVIGALARASLAEAVPTTLVANWFVKKRGRAVAFTTMGFSLGTAVWVPVAQWIIPNYGWRMAWAVMGLGVWGLITLPAWLVVRRRPEDMGLMPDGAGAINRQTTKPTTKGKGNPPEEAVWTMREAMGTRAFWLILMTVVLTAMSDVGIITHMAAYFTDRGFSAAIAASAISTFALVALLVKVFWGFLAEKLHVRYCLILCTVGCALATLGLLVVGDVETVYGAVIFYGLTIGGILTLQAVVWPDYFGRPFLGTIRGFATVLQSTGAALGPLLAAWLYDLQGNYNIAFSLLAAAFLVAALFMLVATPPATKPSHG